MDTPTSMVETHKAQCDAVLAALLAAPAFQFDDGIESKVPKSHGLYVIARKNGSESEYLHAGATGVGKRDRKDGLCARLCKDHRGGNSGSDFIVKVIKQAKLNKIDGELWIRKNCVVQWIVEENKDLRCWAEHYILSILRPKWNC